MSDNNNDQKTYKILVWGDSIGRQCEVPWPDRLQRSMQVSFYCGTDVEVVNITECGLSGIWGQNYFEKKVKPENPDLVIIQFGFNDMRQDKTFGAHPIGTPDEYEEAMCNMIRNSKNIGADVLVLAIITSPSAICCSIPTVWTAIRRWNSTGSGRKAPQKRKARTTST